MRANEINEVHSESKHILPKQTKMRKILTNSAALGSRLRGSISKAVVNTKVSAMHRFSRAEYTEEEPDTEQALQRLKATKTDIARFVKIGRKMYNTLEAQVEAKREYEAMLRSLNDDGIKDEFRTFASAMGEVERDLQKQRETESRMFREKVLEPLEDFLNDDIQKCQEIKLEYKQIKAQYDVAAHSYARISSKDNPSEQKLRHALRKKTETETSLKTARENLQEAVRNLESKKIKELMENFKEFCSFNEQLYTNMATTISGAHLGGDFTSDVIIRSELNNDIHPEFLDTDGFDHVRDANSPISALKSDSGIPNNA